MADVILDAFLDSLKVFAVVAVLTYIIAFIEPLFSKKIRLTGKFAPLIGVSISLIPQCGFAIVATDLYQKKHITIGTLIGVFLATSDEALPVFLSYPDKALHVLPILAFKFIIGLVFGYLIDFIFSKSRRSVHHHVEHCSEEYRIRLMHCESAERVECSDKKESCDCIECTNSECFHKHQSSVLEPSKQNNCEHSLSFNKENTGILSEYNKLYSQKQAKKDKIKRFAIKPLLHSIEVFLYVFIVNIIFAIIIYFIGTERIVDFLTLNKYVAPLFSVLIGAIPNCASSIILSELYIFGGLSFGATLGGLCMNAGLGFIYLFKNTKQLKQNILIISIMFLISIIVSYAFLPLSFKL